MYSRRKVGMMICEGLLDTTLTTSSAGCVGVASVKTRKSEKRKRFCTTARDRRTMIMAPKNSSNIHTFKRTTTATTRHPSQPKPPKVSDTHSTSPTDRWCASNDNKTASLGGWPPSAMNSNAPRKAMPAAVTTKDHQKCLADMRRKSQCHGMGCRRFVTHSSTCAGAVDVLTNCSIIMRSLYFKSLNQITPSSSSRCLCEHRVLRPRVGRSRTATSRTACVTLTVRCPSLGRAAAEGSSTSSSASSEERSSTSRTTSVF
mmetsp:Transcript_13287/g.40189  ORF Transcript_13287/g.40189 Transcript_13287/m.40189 type:complete len:259 (+) Transcript_13287:852-1628(+)